ncbi:hypothetical protein NNG48_07280 [Enterococcus faecium]|nr:hypothetical protein [Enterococcus faecium]
MVDLFDLISILRPETKVNIVTETGKISLKTVRLYECTTSTALFKQVIEIQPQGGEILVWLAKEWRNETD